MFLELVGLRSYNIMGASLTTISLDYFLVKKKIAYGGAFKKH